jgi:uncharacterized BrkB/YihY/UPF0761 family membrane protein
MWIPGLRGLTPARLMKAACRHFCSNDMPMYAAAVTYHLLFSVFPFIIFIIAMLGFLSYRIYLTG